MQGRKPSGEPRLTVGAESAPPERSTDDDRAERLPVRGGWLYQVRVSSTSNSSVALCFVPDAKARHMRELSRERAAAALTEMEERPLGRSLGKRKSR